MIFKGEKTKNYFLPVENFLKKLVKSFFKKILFLRFAQIDKFFTGAKMAEKKIEYVLQKSERYDIIIRVRRIIFFGAPHSNFF